MRRAGICLFCFCLLAGTLPSTFAQGPHITTVSIDNCRLDFQDVNVSFDRKLYQVQWKSIDDKWYFLYWNSPEACSSNAVQAPPGPNPSQTCIVSATKEAFFKYTIKQVNAQGASHSCSTAAPSRVIVNDGQPLHAQNVKDLSKLLTGPTNLDKERTVNIDEACMPSGTPNLYISDNTHLVWKSEIVTPGAPTGVTFTIDLGGSKLCHDIAGTVVPAYQVTSGAEQASAPCYLKSGPSAVLNYTISGSGCTHPFQGAVNIVQ